MSTQSVAERDAAGRPLVPGLIGRSRGPLASSEYGPIARAVRTLERPRDATVALLSNFTIAPLADYILVHAAREGLLVDAVVPDFGQHVQAVVDPRSPVRERRPDLLLLALSLRLLRPEAWSALPSMGSGERERLRDDVLEHIEQWLAAVESWHRGVALVANLAPPVRPGAGVADSRDPYGEVEFYADLNLRILRRVKDEARVRLLDVDRVTAAVGRERSHDPRLFHLAKMEWSPQVLPAMADEVVRHLIAALGRARKCLVLDLDNTLWGGVAGEDGAAGIRIGTGDPVGEAHLEFQRQVRAVQSRGILLAVCSKNNREDVLEVFQRRDEMLLRLEDFAAVAINWDDKVENLRRIATSLNIGLDSLVFVDDNPAEIALVEALLPEVGTLLLAGDPATFADQLDRLPLFEKSVILDEDREKTRQYRENGEREAHRQEVGDLREYLASLGIHVEIRPAEALDLPRLEQLFAKTNQFNLTTRRLASGELERMLHDQETELWLFRSQDRFGDLGIIGAYILAHDERERVLDSFLMSCRAMGRGIETAVVNNLKERLRVDTGVEALRARYLPTPKNEPARRFLDEQGFEMVHEDESGARAYRLDRQGFFPLPCDWIEVTA